MTRSALRTALLVCTLAGCTDVLGGSLGTREVIGMIAGFTDADPRIGVSVAGGVITVTVVTYGGGCDTVGPTRSSRDGRIIEVVPYDYTPVDRRRQCPSVLRTFEHVANIAVQGTGAWTVRVRGRTSSGDSVTEERTVTIEP